MLYRSRGKERTVDRVEISLARFTLRPRKGITRKKLWRNTYFFISLDVTGCVYNDVVVRKF